MNISKLILSVNIAATLPIAVQTVAQASDIVDHQSGHSNESATAGLSANPNRVSIAKKSFDISRPTKSKALEVNGVRLCAFVPNRPLASAQSVSLRSEQAQMAVEQAPLSGRVSDFGNGNSSYQSAYTQSPANSKQNYYSSAPRVMPNQIQAVARVAKQVAKSPAIPRPLATTIQTKLSQFSSNDAPQQDNNAWLANKQNLQIVEPSSENMGGMNAMGGMNNMNSTGNMGGMGQMNTMDPNGMNAMQDFSQQNAGTAGPPPFPLNLLPQKSLKQFIGGRPNRVAGPAAGFGSWHGSGAGSGAAQSRMAQLPACGFHSNITGRNGANSWRASKPVSRAAYIAPKAKNRPVMIAQAPIKRPEVKSYPAYATSTYPSYATAY